MVVIKNIFSLLVLTSSLSQGIAASIYLSAISSSTPSDFDADTDFDESVAEIGAYDPKTKSVFVTNANSNRLDVYGISDPYNPVPGPSIDLKEFGGGVNSVAICNGLMAVAMEADPKQLPGSIIIYDLSDLSATPAVVAAGALPDMATFTPNCQYILVANEGEPDDDYDNDPEGSVTIIPTFGVNKFVPTQVGFSAFNDQEDDLKAAGVRIFGPDATVAKDLEPEYITVSKDSKTAYVSLQENNAIAKIDIVAGTVTGIYPLGFKEHSVAGNGFDASNDGIINIQRWPTLGMYQPDAIASFSVGGSTYIVTANEGDSREYEGMPGFVEEDRVKDVVLDLTAFPHSVMLQRDENLGRLKLTLANGDTDGDGEFEEIYSFGGRSFSIFDENLNLVYDSGNDFETITEELIPAFFNTDNDEKDPADGFDARSDDKGPEPEGLAIGMVRGRTYAFIGLERVGGIMVYDVSNPQSPEFVQYARSEDSFGGEVVDLGPEGLVFVSEGDSPIPGVPIVIVTHEVSGTTTIYRVDSM